MSSSMHAAFEPLTFVLSSICELLKSLSMELIVLPLPFVGVSVFPVVLSIALFDSLYELTLKIASIFPCFFSLSVLEISSPSSLVLAAIFTNVDTCTIGLIMQPFTLVSVSILMDKFSVTPCAIFFPVSFIFGPIAPYLSAFALSHISFDIAIIDGSIFESYNFPFRLGIAIWLKLLNRFQLIQSSIVKLALSKFSILLCTKQFLDIEIWFV